MGTWGTAISSNDTYADVRAEFFELYKSGQNIGEISAKLIANNRETISDPDDCNNFWFALAKAQWECKELAPDLLIRINSIIESGSDLEVWRTLDADEKTIEKRRLALSKFQSELGTERPKAKPRKKKVIRQPPFEKGDCLTFKLYNGNYGGAVVLETVRDTEFGIALLAATQINQKDKPTKADFESADVLTINYATWEDEPRLIWYFPRRHKKIEHLIETVAKIEVEVKYTPDYTKYGFTGDFVWGIIQVAELQFNSELTKPSPTKILTIKSLTKKSKWRFW